MNKSLLWITSITLVLFSCGIAKIRIVLPTNSERTVPDLNNEFEAEVGESLVEREFGSTYKSLILLNEVKHRTSINGKIISFSPGTIFTLMYESSKYFTYVKDMESRWAVQIDKENGSYWLSYDLNGILVYKATSTRLDSSQFRMSKVPDKKKYFRQTFLYNGKIGSGLKFTYREFTDDLARPAFTQDLQYDLSEGNVVGFKGLRIEVIKAENTKIRYKVLNYFKE